jgi:hypothetical protein
MIKSGQNSFYGRTLTLAGKCMKIQNNLYLSLWIIAGITGSTFTMEKPSESPSREAAAQQLVWIRILPKKEVRGKVVQDEVILGINPKTVASLEFFSTTQKTTLGKEKKGFNHLTPIDISSYNITPETFKLLLHCVEVVNQNGALDTPTTTLITTQSLQTIHQLLFCAQTFVASENLTKSIIDLYAKALDKRFKLNSNECTYLKTPNEYLLEDKTITAIKQPILLPIFNTIKLNFIKRYGIPNKHSDLVDKYKYRYYPLTLPVNANASAPIHEGLDQEISTNPIYGYMVRNKLNQIIKIDAATFTVRESYSLPIFHNVQIKAFESSLIINPTQTLIAFKSRTHQNRRSHCALLDLTSLDWNALDIPLDSNLYALAAYGRKIVWGSAEHGIIMLNIDTGKVKKLSTKDRQRPICGNISNIVAFPGENPSDIKILNIDTLEPMCTIHDEFDKPAPGETNDEFERSTRNTTKKRILTFSPDDEWLASNSVNNSITIWDASNGHVIKQLPMLGATGMCQSIAFNQGKTILAVADTSGTIYLWDLQKELMLAMLKFDHFKPHQMVFSMEEDLILSGMEKKKSKIIKNSLFPKEKCDLMKDLMENSDFTLLDTFMIQQIYKRKMMSPNKQIKLSTDEQNRINDWPEELQDLFNDWFFE